MSVLLNALQELDFDHGLGKIPVEDYQPQRTLLLQRAANICDTLGLSRNYLQVAVEGSAALVNSELPVRITAAESGCVRGELLA